MFGIIISWWKNIAYPKVDKWCDDHTKILLTIGLVLFILAASGAITTYLNLRANKGYIEKLNEAQKIVESQRNTIKELNKNLEEQLASMKELQENHKEELAISNKVSEIIQTTIDIGSDSLNGLINDMDMYELLISQSKGGSDQ